MLNLTTPHNQYSNVLLVVPRYSTYGATGHYVMPMGTLYVSAYLKAAQVTHVHTLNLNHHDGAEETVLQNYIHTHSVGMVALGGISGEYQDVARIAQTVKHIDPSLTVVIGGGIVTADPETTMRAIAQADYGIVGEGEITMVELIMALRQGVPLHTVQGVVFWDKGQFVATPARTEIVDLDTLPLPDYAGFDYDIYLEENPDMSDEGKRYSQVSVIGGRSCKYNCTFCFHPSGTTYRQRSLDSIFSEIDYLVSHYNISYIALREELFATDNERVAEFCQRVESYDFDWSIQLRIDNINPALVQLLKGTRCRYLFVGVESADDSVLRSMHKGVTRSQIEEALEMLRQAGLNSRSGVIFGDAAETVQSAANSLSWFRNNHSRYRMFADMIIAFPGSALYKKACKKGVIPDPVQFLKDGCPIVNLSEMSREDFMELVKTIEKINYRSYNVKEYKL